VARSRCRWPAGVRDEGARHALQEAESLLSEQAAAVREIEAKATHMRQQADASESLLVQVDAEKASAFEQMRTETPTWTVDVATQKANDWFRRLGAIDNRKKGLTAQAARQRERADALSSSLGQAAESRRAHAELLHAQQQVEAALKARDAVLQRLRDATAAQKSVLVEAAALDDAAPVLT